TRIDGARVEPRTACAPASAGTTPARRAASGREALCDPSAMAPVTVHRPMDAAERLPKRAVDTRARAARSRQVDALPNHAAHHERARLPVLRRGRPPCCSRKDAANDPGATPRTFATRPGRCCERTGHA